MDRPFLPMRFLPTALSAKGTSVATLGAANCWNAVTPDGRFVYVSNAGSSTISRFAISSRERFPRVQGRYWGRILRELQTST
jgi:6-phosphogluconolactonase